MKFSSPRKMFLTDQQHIQWYFDTADAILAPKLLLPKKVKSKKIKVCLNLKWLRSTLIQLKIFWLLSSFDGECGASGDTKMSDVRYKQYPKKISGYTSASYNSKCYWKNQIFEILEMTSVITRKNGCNFFVFI